MIPGDWQTTLMVTLGCAVAVGFVYLLLPRRRNRRRQDVLPAPRSECKRPGVEAVTR